MEHSLRLIDSDELFKYLVRHGSPVSESELLKRFLPEMADSLLAGVSMKLYSAHFILYHNIYMLTEKAAESGYALHVNLIYVYLLKIPPEGACAQILKDENRFCGLKCDEGERLCGFHGKKHETLRRAGTLDIPDISTFYLNPENLDAFDEERLELFARGIFRYAAHYREIDRCLNILGLSLDYTLDRLKNRYRYLTKRFHPDLGENGPFPFAEITNAYHVLLDLKTGL